MGHYLDPVMSVVNSKTAIAINGSVSNSFCKKSYENVVIIMPSAWTTADLTFLVSDDNVTFGDLYVGDNAEALVEVNVTGPAASQVIALTGKLRDALKSCPYIKIRSGVTATPVAQAAARTFKIILMR